MHTISESASWCGRFKTQCWSFVISLSLLALGMLSYQAVASSVTITKHASETVLALTPAIATTQDQQLSMLQSPAQGNNFNPIQYVAVQHEINASSLTTEAVNHQLPIVVVPQSTCSNQAVTVIPVYINQHFRLVLGNQQPRNQTQYVPKYFGHCTSVRSELEKLIKLDDINYHKGANNRQHNIAKVQQAYQTYINVLTQIAGIYHGYQQQQAVVHYVNDYLYMTWQTYNAHSRYYPLYAAFQDHTAHLIIKILNGIDLSIRYSENRELVLGAYYQGLEAFVSQQRNTDLKARARIIVDNYERVVDMLTANDLVCSHFSQRVKVTSCFMNYMNLVVALPMIPATVHDALVSNYDNSDANSIYVDLVSVPLARFYTQFMQPLRLPYFE